VAISDYRPAALFVPNPSVSGQQFVQLGLNGLLNQAFGALTQLSGSAIASGVGNSITLSLLMVAYLLCCFSSRQTDFSRVRRLLQSRHTPVSSIALSLARLRCCKYPNVALLIIDEMGVEPMGR